MNNHLILFPNSVLVKGYLRSAIYDLQRRELQFIPNDMHEFLIKNNKKLIAEIMMHYNDSDRTVIKGYLEFLFQNEYAYKGTVEDTKVLDKLSFEYDFPSMISNSIWEISEQNYEYKEKILTGLDFLHCDTLQIIEYSSWLEFDRLNELLEFINNECRLLSVELIICYNDTYELEKVKLLCNKYLKVNKLIIHSSPFAEVVRMRNKTEIHFTKEVISSNKCCGTIDSSYFVLNEKLLFESKNFNNCLNRKISIDHLGYIKNCPSLVQNFGHVEEIELKDALKQKKFTKYWGITKDQVEVCKDCEFRYVCTDCRAYLENPSNDYSKPLKCGYDPYTNKWDDWSKNPLKKVGIEYYGMQSEIENE